MRFVTILIGLLCGAVLLGALALDEGEVVTLTTYNGDGKAYETQVWFVEREGDTYLRAHYTSAEWLGRLRARPEVQLERDERQQPFLAHVEDDDATRRAVNQAMAAKYGRSDRLVSWFFDVSAAVPVRLEPRGEPSEAAPAHH
jgi:hypothetical protein